MKGFINGFLNEGIKNVLFFKNDNKFFFEIKIAPTLKAIAKNTQNVIQNIKLNDKENIFQKDKDIIEIHPRINITIFPSEEKIKSMSEFLNMNFSTNYFIWNLSEISYDSSYFNNQVLKKK